ncbi:MAG TPA: NUDIX hydrolase [Candidatus Borkfalkia faecavium]|uniref:NUDIX hydrolase n=1 Tax=Candidatus Borkfalkia faecavium TaxID=2838508 RepID=A0A9D1W227_9FIRM|nr:NUDIX hydrolase [Candidatus Borkfalkia faecavium]
MNLTEKTVKQNVVFEGKIIRVRCDDAELPDGKPCKREVVDHAGGASVLYVREGKVLLVRQFRYPYMEETLEIPAGKLNPGEDPARTAARELAEETGWQPASVEHMFTIYPTPGYSAEKIYIYRAHGVREGQVHPDEDEFVTAAFYPVDEVLSMIEKGEIKDAKTIIAVMSLRLQK